MVPGYLVWRLYKPKSEVQEKKKKKKKTLAYRYQANT